MRKLVNIIILFWFLLPCLMVQGAIVPVEDARLIARNIYFERIQPFRIMQKENVKITEELTVSMGGQPVYYAFNIGKKEGFVIVSAEDLVYPVLGYSFEGSFRTDDHNPAFAELMNSYEVQIMDSRKGESFRFAEIEEVWDRYKDLNFAPAKDLQTVEPLCKTKWGQGTYYNDSCPGNAVVGCVAVAMGQVMVSFKWPPQGKGTYSYTHSVYGPQSANFGATTYNWNAMANQLTSPNPAVAQLLYHCGVSVDMNYSPGGSGASIYRAMESFYAFFRYNMNRRVARKNDYSDIYWKILIRAQHMNGRPVMYAGPGHAFVCDGFQYPDHFHFNWGWSGSYDGYFYLTSLKPGTSNYTSDQLAIVDNYPDTTSKSDGFGEGGKRIQEELPEVQVLPNPVSDGKVLISLMNDYEGYVTITVRNVSGQLAEEIIVYKDSEWFKYDINLFHLKNGFYILGFEMDNKVVFEKILIQRH